MIGRDLKRSLSARDMLSHGFSLVVLGLVWSYQPVSLRAQDIPEGIAPRRPNCNLTVAGDWCDRAGGVKVILQHPSGVEAWGCGCFNPEKPNPKRLTRFFPMPFDPFPRSQCDEYLTWLCYNCFPRGGGAGNLPECSAF
jgi:hypothetical protein